MFFYILRDSVGPSRLLALPGLLASSPAILMDSSLLSAYVGPYVAPLTLILAMRVCRHRLLSLRIGPSSSTRIFVRSHFGSSSSAPWRAQPALRCSGSSDVVSCFYGSLLSQEVFGTDAESYSPGRQKDGSLRSRADTGCTSASVRK